MRTGFFFSVAFHAGIVAVSMLGLPLKTSGELTAVRRPAPWLGQHSRAVLAALGYDQADIDALFAAGVVGEREAV